MKQAKQIKQERKATVGGSVLVMLLVIAILLIGVFVLKLEPYIPLMTATLPIIIYGLHLHISWKDMMDQAYKSIGSCTEPSFCLQHWYYLCHSS